jgi:hypothetical protein
MDIAQIGKDIDQRNAWRDALTDYAKGDPAALAAMLRGGDPMPAEIAVELADYLDGARRASARNADKRKLTAGQRRAVAEQWRRLSRQLDAMAADADRVWEDHGELPEDWRRRVRQWKRDILAELVQRHGVSAELIRKL